MLGCPNDIFEKNHYISIVSECPSMPAKAELYNYFLRFSSKVSRPLTAYVEPSIQGIYQIAWECLWCRIH